MTIDMACAVVGFPKPKRVWFYEPERVVWLPTCLDPSHDLGSTRLKPVELVVLCLIL